MNMGLIERPLLESVGGTFIGEVVLPVCIRRRMRWHATVTAEGPDGVSKARFVFEINNDRRRLHKTPAYDSLRPEQLRQ
jgi:hypothetical protein